MNYSYSMSVPARSCIVNRSSEYHLCFIVLYNHEWFHRESLLPGPCLQGYGRGRTPVFTGVFEPLARVTLYLTDENGLDSCFGAA